MALTKVSGHIIDQPFDVGILTATNSYVSGIGTFGNIRVLGDLQIDGTTTTLDTVVTEVDRLEVGANNSTVGVAITQTGTGDILNLYDGSTEVFSVIDGGDVSIIDKIVHTGDTNTAIRFPAADTVTVETGGSERLRIDSTGRVLIGSTNVDTVGSPNQNVIIGSTTNNEEAALTLSVIEGSNNRRVKFFLDDDDGVYGFDSTSSSGTAPFVIRSATSEQLRIKSDGKIGIGTDNPAQKLHVFGNTGTNIQIEQTSGNIYLGSSGNTRFGLSSGANLIQSTSVDFAIGSFGGNSLIFGTNNSERLRITSTGRVGINETAPSAQLDVRTDEDPTSGLISFIRNNTSAGNGAFYGMDVNGVGNWSLGIPDNTDAFTIVDGEGNSGTERLRIDSSGRLGTGNVTPGDYWDEADDLVIKTVGDTGITIASGSSSSDTGTIAFADGTSGDARKRGYIQYTQSSEYMTFGVNAAERLRITAAGEVRVPDNGKFTAGNSDDLQIYHNATNSLLENNAGHLYIRNNVNDSHVFIQSDNGSGGVTQYIKCDGADGAVKLSHYGSQKIVTTSTGVEVSGATKTDTLEVTQEYPSIRPTLDLNFAATKALDRRITFTRDGVGTYVDDMGILKYASNNVPRFDHDPTTGESLGLLIEESRTNILGLSTDLTDNNGNDWDNINGTIAVNQTTAPDGTTTAASFTASAGNAEHSVVFAELVPTGNVTVSVWVKTNTYSIVSFVMFGEANSTVSYNINTKTVYNQGSNVSRATITEYPNGWYRISATMNCTVSSSRVYRLYASTGNFNAGGSESFYYWGPQVESGDFETSYIPTYASNTSVTRTADFAAIRRTNFTDFYNSDEGTIYCEFTHGVRPWHFCDADTSQSQRFFGFSNNSGGIRVGRNASGWTYISAPTTGSYSRGDDIKSAVSYGPTSFSVGAFGQVADSGTTNTNTGIDRLLFYQDTSNPDSNGTIRALKYYNKRLSNAQLQGLTVQ